MKSETFDHIASLLAMHSATAKNQISLETRLFHDLLIEGDDADAFLQEFSRIFQVDLSRFPFIKFFPPERPASPGDLISLITGVFKRSKASQKTDSAGTFFPLTV